MTYEKSIWTYRKGSKPPIVKEKYKWVSPTIKVPGSFKWRWLKNVCLPLLLLVTATKYIPVGSSVALKLERFGFISHWELDQA